MTREQRNIRFDILCNIFFFFFSCVQFLVEVTTELLILEYRDKEKGKKEITLRREKEFEKIQRSITRRKQILKRMHMSQY